LLLKRWSAILRVVDSFIETKTFTAILFAVAVVLGAIGVFGKVEGAAMEGLVVGAGAVVHLLVFHL
jgi:hypothetical protein